MKKVLISSLFRTSIITLLFALSYIFYNLELVRGNVEDIAFDAVDKFVIAKKEQNLTSPKVMLFTIDDTYLKTNRLLDEDNETNYGFYLPNDKIADFIDELDEFVEDVEPSNMPKVLFVDFDFKFTTAEYGKKLNFGDTKLIESLSRDRNYTILLPKTSKYNFIENLENRKIQELIKKKKIIFVSVAMLKSKDDTTRRYLSYRSYKDKNGTKDYINVEIAIKQLLDNGDINSSLAKKNYLQNDIIANRIWLKDYKNHLTEKECVSMQSLWRNYTKYSASCNLYDLDEDDFAQSIVLLGTTHSSSDDAFETLNLFGAKSFYGIEMHANAIETLFHLDGQLKRLGFWQSVTLMFMVFFILSFVVSYIFKVIKIDNGKIEFLITLAIVTIVLILISIYLLNEHKLWFNWLVPLLLYELVEVLEHLQNFIFNRIKKEEK